MVKKCKLTKVLNGNIYGIVEHVIREGDVVNLTEGQIAICLGYANVDEVLSDGSLVRLDRSNYKLKHEPEVIKPVVVEPVKVAEPEPVVEEVAPAEEVVEETTEVEEETVEEEVSNEPVQYTKKAKKKNNR